MMLKFITILIKYYVLNNYSFLKDNGITNRAMSLIALFMAVDYDIQINDNEYKLRLSFAFCIKIQYLKLVTVLGTLVIRFRIISNHLKPLYELHK